MLSVAADHAGTALAFPAATVSAGGGGDGVAVPRGGGERGGRRGRDGVGRPERRRVRGRGPVAPRQTEAGGDPRGRRGARAERRGVGGGEDREGAQARAGRAARVCRTRRP